MRFIVPVLVGAIIGYITNWLAIKMLFRPYKEIKIFGLKLPFTPGLIPKERDRIAKSIGETIGTHLLTPEIVVGALCSEKIDNQINVMIKDKVEELKESKLTAVQIISGITGLSEEKIEGKLEDLLSSFIISKLSGEGFRIEIRDIIYMKITEGSKELRKSELYGNLVSYALKNIKGSLTSEHTIGFISSSIEEKISELKLESKTLAEVVPSSMQQSLRMFIFNNREKMIGLIKEGIENEAVREKLKLTVASMVEESLGKLVTMFISMDTVGNKVLDAIDKYVDKPENQENIVYIIINSIDRFMASEVRELAANFPEETSNILSNKLAKVLTSYLSEERVISRLRDFIDERVENGSNELIEIVFSKADEYLAAFMASKELQGLIKAILRGSLIEGVLNQPVSIHINRISESQLEKISLIARNFYDEFVKNRASQMVELIDISGIVEDRINSFDVAFGEKIILEVANRELKAITWLGALLGAVMGVLSPLIQMLTL